MNPSLKSLVAITPFLALLAGAPDASAQVEPRPNVLLLVDSSGSMEYRSGFAFTAEGEIEVFPNCAPDQALAEETCPAERQIEDRKCYNNEKSRWIELVEVLTGEVPNYRCEAMVRSPRTTKFEDLYMLGGVLPGDYEWPYHRLLTAIAGSGSPTICGPGPAQPNPGDPATLASRLPLNDIVWKEYTDTSTDNCGGLDDNDPTAGFGRGLLDVFGNEIRFGLMTFDTEPKFGVGDGSFAAGIAGTWDYQALSDTAHVGRPVGCLTDAVMEVGARNQYAPGWEGRLIGFGDPAQAEADPDRNRSIQRILLATRPLGATPIAGMLHDAEHFLFKDTQMDPVEPTHTLGPHLDDATNDPYAGGECRQNAIILLTDGEPNSEMRPNCEDPTTGIDVSCPFRRPEETAASLAAGNGSVHVVVYVVGFSLSKVTIGTETKECSALNLAPGQDCDEATIAAQPDAQQRPLKTCCLLNRIAAAGGTERAHFAANRDELAEVLYELMQRLTSNASARTRPVFASATEYGYGNFSFRFLTGFLPQEKDLRRGVLERKRLVCPAGATGDAVEQDLDSVKGDDFVANVNRHGGSNRRFFTFEGSDGTNIQSSVSLRPGVTGASPDGIPLGGGAAKSAKDGAIDSYVDDLGLSAAALDVSSTSCPVDTGLTAEECANAVMRWAVGAPNGSYRSRCDGGVCNLIADIYHSTPVLVGPPSSLIPDETYRKFAGNATGYRFASRGPPAKPAEHRPLVLYTSTNDGMLHAFRVFPPVDYDPENETALQALEREHEEVNELWAFIPPAVLPIVPQLYPDKRQLVLDGEPVVRDVVAVPKGAANAWSDNVGEAYPWTLARSADEAETNASTWRTILVQGFGDSLAGGGYFALDVTDPETGPRFLWQLTVGRDGQALFGKTVAPPLITTLFLKEAAMIDGFREVAVAVLPGGASAKSTAPDSTCDLQAVDPQNVEVDSTFPVRETVRCYSQNPATPEPARSVTIVRLDTGEVLASFRDPNQVGSGLGVDEGVVRLTELVAPVTGRPAAFPAGTGAIADRVYVGDAEGVLWRIDLSSPNPNQWRMAPFFDAYSTMPAATAAHSGQPIVTPPILSTDELGGVVISFSTGSQDFDEDAKDDLGNLDTMKTFVWSLRELEDSSTGHVLSKAQWYVELAGRERVTGPMQLFDGTLYFTSFWPVSSAGVCTVGESKVWGMDYVAPAEAALREGGKGKLTVGTLSGQRCMTSASSSDPNSGEYECPQATLPAGSSIFGVTVAQTPSCSDAGAATTDAFTGTGMHTSVSTLRPGKFQLLMQTGKAGEVTGGGVTPSLAVDLKTPPTVPVIESWAAIVE
ncbi:MAG: hypothetical protein JW751_13950 [Polyangiaceae bacterium]|nr:hypothetical protein [Polyangiaceae bacterium]